MLSAVLLSSSMLLAAPHPAGAPEPAAGLPDAHVAAVVADLAAPAFRRRRAARADLARLGADALPLLIAARAADPHDEAADALDAAIERLSAGDAGPATVTLSLHRAEPAQALAAVSRALGVPVAAEPADLFDRLSFAPVTADWRGAPAWRVVLDLAAGWNLYVRAGRDGFTLTDRPHHALPPAGGVIEAGVLMRMHSVRRDRIIRFDPPHHPGGRPDGHFTLAFRCHPEPALRPAAGAATAHVVAAWDDRGHDLAGEPGVVDDHAVGWTVTLPLVEPERDGGTVIPRIAGHVERQMLAGFVEVTAGTDRGGAAGHAAPAGDLALSVGAAEHPERGRATVALTAEQPTGRHFAAVDLTGDVTLTDAEGSVHRLRPGDVAQVRRGLIARTTATVPLPRSAALPGTITWRVPTRRETAEIPFEFRDVPIP